MVDEIKFRRFLYEIRLDKPEDYLETIIDFSECEYLQRPQQKQGRKVYMGVSLSEPSVEGPFTVGYEIEVSEFFVHGVDIPRSAIYKISQIEKYCDERFLETKYNDATRNPTDEELNDHFKAVVDDFFFRLTHPDYHRSHPKTIIPDYIAYAVPTGKVHVHRPIPMEQLLKDTTPTDDEY